MRLADFIERNEEPILAEWEEFARTHIPVGEAMDVLALRDHAGAMLKVVARDLRTPQTERQRGVKAQGDVSSPDSAPDTAAETHGALRAEAGFTLAQMVSEFRALRASVTRLWHANGMPGREDLEDLTRFNEAIDQALAESVSRYARDLEHSKEMFLAILGHDVRTPLGAIMMSATALMVSHHEGSPEQEAVSRILGSGTRISRLVNDLLDFTRTRLGDGIPLSYEEVDLRDVCRQVIDEAAAYHPDRKVQFGAATSERGSWDGARMGQALANLVGNAVQHGSAEAPVTVTLSGTPTEVTIAVHNTGPVIPQTQMRQIFSPLKRIARGTPRPQDAGSMGLGLYIANEIVRAHGGSIEVASTESEGTTFTARLPRSR